VGFSFKTRIPIEDHMSKRSLFILAFVFFMIVPDGVFSQGTVRVLGTKGSSPGRNEVIAIETMKELYAAEAVYFRQNPFQPDYFGNLQELADAGLIDPLLGSGERSGYRFTIHTTPGTAISPANFMLLAWPIEYRRTGRRSFFMISNCLVRGDDKMGGFAGESDPVVDSCDPTVALSFGVGGRQFLRTLSSVQFTYAATAGNGSYGSVEQLYQAGLIDEAFYNVTVRHWHVYQMVTTAPTATMPATFKIWATPGRYRQSGVVSYYIDQTAVIRGADRQGAMAHEDDPPIVEDENRESKF
jgi:hypothetical protein